MAGSPDPAIHATAVPTAEPTGTRAEISEPAGRGKVAVLSFLFNWPSTGGGIVHTVELAKFLTKAGYDVRHIYARYAPWQIGRVEGRLPFPSDALEFDQDGWNVLAIQEHYRRSVDAFRPDHVLITDSWNMKPLLAEAVRGYPYILRFQAMECLCPLNGVRLLPEDGGRFRQCAVHQLASPQVCAGCIRRLGNKSGGLHQADRALAGVGTPEYHDRLVRALGEAEAVLVVNPLHEAMISPYAQSVRVVTSGMDPARFPWPWPEETVREKPLTLFFAGLVDEWMKGFRVLHEACTRLRRRRQDFELVAPAIRPGGLTSSRAISAGSRKKICRVICGPPTLSSCPRLPRKRSGARRSRRWPWAGR
jgi:glycosyltransferase involved in cell wall biosynthesis